MKKNYEKPEIEAIELEVEDIIQTSGGVYSPNVAEVIDGGYTGNNSTGGKANAFDVTSGTSNDWL